MFEGQRISHYLRNVIIAVTCVRPGAAYLASVENHGGGLIPELTRSYPDETQARLAARIACHLFADGQSVREVLDLLGTHEPALAG